MSDIDTYAHAIDTIHAYDGTGWDAELALAREMSESVTVDYDEGPCAIGYKWDGLTYWFLIDETGCEWDADDPRETMIAALLAERDRLRVMVKEAHRIDLSPEGRATYDNLRDRYFGEHRAEVERLRALIVEACDLARPRQRNMEERRLDAIRVEAIRAESEAR